MKKKKITIFTILKVAFLLLILAISLYPFIYMLAVSFSDNVYVLKSQISFYPKGFTTKVYEIVFADKRIFTAYRNTIVYTVIGTSVAIAVTSAGAFAMSKKRIIFFRFFNTMIIITMFFSGGLIPTYLTIRQLGLLNTMWAIILPTSVSVWNFIIMRSFFDQFPDEIEESGRMDGLNDATIFWYLVLPVSKAVFATVGLFYAVALWNAYFYPFIYLSSPEKLPLQVILREILMAGSNSNEAVGVGDTAVIEESLKYATVLVSVVPIIAIYPFVQKYFVKGVMVGSVKG